MLAFEVAGGRAAGQALIDALTIPELTASLGSVYTMVVHPPSTTQRQLTRPRSRRPGSRPGLLRVSVGLEDLEDLEADFADALAAARARSAPPATPAAVSGVPPSRRRTAVPAAIDPTRPVERRSPGSGAGCGACSPRSTSRSPRSSSCWSWPLVGMTIRQLPDFAFRSAGDYAAAMDDIHARYDPVLGRGVVDVLERLQVFHIFRSTWFSVGLIVLVDLDRRLHARPDAAAVARRRARSGSSSPSRSSTRGCRTGRR